MGNLFYWFFLTDNKQPDSVVMIRVITGKSTISKEILTFICL
jgi:hypothetical protein